jgi:formamidopyrimidine-DNA glycosylase
MPELPEVETVRRGLAPTMVGARIERVELRRPDLRFPFPERFVERLTGRTILALRRRAKYLLGELDSGETLVMHLGMSGSFRIEGELAAEFHHPRSKAPAHDHVAFGFACGASVVYNDPRRFGYMTLVATDALEAHPLFAEMGVEPLGPDFTAARLGALLEGARTPLKSALLDQRRIAGLGNIYVCEALHRARLSPLREAGGLTGREARALAKAIRSVLEAAIEAGGSTLRDHRQADGTLGYFQHAFAVYDREGVVCGHKRCGGIIARAVQSGRSTFYCSACQL